MVSIETGPAPRRLRPSTTGAVRRVSSSAATLAAPGRVDSPPTSTQSAPSSNRRRPRATAASVPASCPPSEKESGVTLRMPMTSVRSPSTTGAPLSGMR